MDPGQVDNTGAGTAEYRYNYMALFRKVKNQNTEAVVENNQPVRIEPARGYNIYYLNQVMPIHGYDKFGHMVRGEYEYPWFVLTPEERIDIAKKSSYIFGVVTNRMNRIGSLQYKVVSNRHDLDVTIGQLKTLKSTYNDFKNSGDMRYVLAAGVIAREIRKTLTDCLPDLSNFQRALVRFTRRVNAQKQDRCAEIEDWLMCPNDEDQFEDILKKYTFDMMVHGQCDIYKKYENGIITKYYILPGGTVYPLRRQYVGERPMWAQVVPGKPTLIYDKAEIIHDTYAPTSFSEYGIVPLDALVNKVSEQLLSERYWAGQADGTAPPEKLLAIQAGSQIPGQVDFGLNPKEQKRIEENINQFRRQAIRTITGTGPIEVLDISKRDMLDGQLRRLEEIKKDVALVFNMSNLEINETGSDGTSGRETSETQERQEKLRGTYPLIKSFQEKINEELIRPKFGDGCRLKLMSSNDEYEQLELIKAKMDTGVYAINRIMTEDLNLEPYEGDQFDQPPGPAAPSMNQAVSDEVAMALRKNGRH